MNIGIILDMKRKICIGLKKILLWGLIRTPIDNFEIRIQLLDPDPQHRSKIMVHQVNEVNNLERLVHLSFGSKLKDEVNSRLIVEIAEQPAK